MITDHKNNLSERLSIDGYFNEPVYASKNLLDDLSSLAIAGCRPEKIRHVGGSIVGHLNFSFGSLLRENLDQILPGYLIEIAKEYLKTDALRVVLGGNVNLPGSVNQRWHTDALHSDQFLLANIPLVDITNLNGPTEMLPRTHTKELKFAEFQRLRRNYPESVVSLSGLKRGALHLRDARLWHRGTANRSQFIRSVITISLHRSVKDVLISEDLVGARSNSYSGKYFARHSRFYELLYWGLPWLGYLKKLIK